MTEAIATPPSIAGSPRRPIAVVETMPINGVVRFGIIAGPAMANTCRVVTTGREGASNAVGQRPRGAPNTRDSSQIGITMTAPSRK